MALLMTTAPHKSKSENSGQSFENIKFKSLFSIFDRYLAIQYPTQTFIKDQRPSFYARDSIVSD